MIRRGGDRGRDSAGPRTGGFWRDARSPNFLFHPFCEIHTQDLAEEGFEVAPELRFRVQRDGMITKSLVVLRNAGRRADDPPSVILDKASVDGPVRTRSRALSNNESGACRWYWTKGTLAIIRLLVLGWRHRARLRWGRGPRVRPTHPRRAR